MRLRTPHLTLSAAALYLATACGAQPYFVSPTGDDANPGTLGKPFATLHRAQAAARQACGEIFLRGGIKSREGFRRTVENNILVDGGFHPHVWYASNGDIFRRNIVWTDYRPAYMPPPPWGAEMDFNLVHDSRAAAAAPATQLQTQSRRDGHSIIADAQFVDPSRGDYRVREGSPALALGFANFPMDTFGVRKPGLKAIARTPSLPRAADAAPLAVARDPAPATWFGASVRNIVDAGEMSAFGLPGVTGILVLNVPTESPLADAGLREGDVILSINGEPAADTVALARHAPESATQGAVTIGISRNQHAVQLRLPDSPHDARPR